MIWPIEFRRIALCTGPEDSMPARYAAYRLTTAFREASVTVFHQSGGTKRPFSGDAESVTRRVTMQLPHGRGSAGSSVLKRSYWHMRRSTREWKLDHWRRRYFVRDARRADRLLAREMRRPGTVLSWPTIHCVSTVNDQAESIRAMQPDVLLIFGGGIVDAAILQSARVALNVHCGKLPEYRGVHSALFALAQGRPDHVGVTVHVAEASLDSGAIAAWCPFPMDRVFSMHELRYGLCREGLSTAINVIRELGETGIHFRQQTGAPRLRRARDVTVDTIRSAYGCLRGSRASEHEMPVGRRVSCCVD